MSASAPRADSTMIGTSDFARIAPADLGALEIGQPQVEHDQIRRPLPRTARARPRRCRRCPRRSRAIAAAAPPPAEWRPRRRRAGCAGDASSARRAAGSSLSTADRHGHRELRAAVRAVLRPDAPVLDRQQSADDPQAHAGARGARLRCRAAIEALEQVRQVGRRDARRRDRAPRSSAPRRSTRAVTSIVDPRGEYCAAFSSRCASAVAVRRGSSRTGTSGSMRDLHLVCPAACARPDRARPRRSPTDASSAIRWPPRRHRCAPSRGRSGTAASGARPPTGSDRSAPSRSSRVSSGAWRLLAAMRIAVSGVRRSWPSEASSAVFSCSLCRVSSPALRSSRNCARSIAIATTPASVSSVPASTGRPAAASRPIGFVPTRSGTSRMVPPVDRHRAMTGVGAGVARRIRAMVCAAANAFDSWRRVELDRPRAGLVDVPLVRRAARAMATNSRSNRRAIDRASTASASRLSVIISTSRLRSNSRASSSRRPTASSRAGAGDSRQVAGDQADGEEREQRDPVLRVGDRERADRRQEEEVEGRASPRRRSTTATHRRDVAATTSTTIR